MGKYPRNLYYISDCGLELQYLPLHIFLFDLLVDSNNTEYGHFLISQIYFNLKTCKI